MRAVIGCPVARPIGWTTGVRAPCNHGASTRCRARTVSFFAVPFPSSHSPVGSGSPMERQANSTASALEGMHHRRRGMSPTLSWRMASLGVGRPAALVSAARSTPLPVHALVRNDNIAISMGVDHG
jgi:hypothetical protein